MFVRVKNNKVVEFFPFNTIKDKLHPDIVAQCFSVDEEMPQGQYVITEDIFAEVQVPVLNEMGDLVLDEQGNPTFQTINQKVGQRAIATEPPPVEPEPTDLFALVKQSINFGNSVIEQFTVENILLGITQDNMTETVLDVMEPVMAALRTGSLYVAINRLKAIPVESKDNKYITDTRLLAAVNQIEQHLGLQLSTSL